MGINEICSEVRVPVRSVPTGVSVPSQTQADLDALEGSAEVLSEFLDVLGSLDTLLGLRDEIQALRSRFSSTAVELYNDMQIRISRETTLDRREVSVAVLFDRMLTILQNPDRALARQYQERREDRQADIAIISDLSARAREIYQTARDVLQNSEHPIASQVYNNDQRRYAGVFLSRSLTPTYGAIITAFRQNAALQTHQAILSALDPNDRGSVRAAAGQIRLAIVDSCTDYNEIIVGINPPPTVTPVPVPEIPTGPTTPTSAVPRGRTADDFIDYFIEVRGGAIFDFSQSGGWETWGVVFANLLIMLNLRDDLGLGAFLNTGHSMGDSFSSRDSDVFGGAELLYCRGRSCFQLDVSGMQVRHVSVDDDRYYRGEELTTLGELRLGGSFFDQWIRVGGSFLFGSEFGFTLRLNSVLRAGRNGAVLFDAGASFSYLSGEPDASAMLMLGLRCMPRIWGPLRFVAAFGWSFDPARDESQGVLSAGLAVGDLWSPNRPGLGLERF